LRHLILLEVRAAGSGEDIRQADGVVRAAGAECENEQRRESQPCSAFFPIRR
jgi:hypothetical protein